MKADTVEVRPLLPGLSLLFPFFTAGGGEKQGVCAVPEKSAGFAVPGQAQGRIPVFQNPEIAEIPVFSGVGFGAEMCIRDRWYGFLAIIGLILR